MEPSRDIARLLALMARLRDPIEGCAWDVKQTFQSIVPYTIEESHEVADAVARGDMDDLRDELGDLLLQVVFHSRIAEEAGLFDFGAVVEAITAKLVRRHPHVFGSARGATPAEVKAIWASVKAEEKRARVAKRGTERTAFLDGVPGSLPALLQAVKLQSEAAKVGFDWSDARLVLDKIKEEADELAAALPDADAAEVRDEIGDLLFAAVNLARHAGIDPETALAGTNAKFRRRFSHIERSLAADDRSLEGASLAEMEELWQDAKRRERQGKVTSSL